MLADVNAELTSESRKECGVHLQADAWLDYYRL